MKPSRWIIAFVAATTLAFAAACEVSDDETATTPTPVTVTESAPAAPAPAAEPVSPSTTAPTADKPPLRFIPTVRGTADLLYLQPVTKVEATMVVTRFEVKNTSPKAIAGLKIDEFWRDKAGNLVGGGSARLRAPLLPGDTATLVIETPKDRRMYRNQYQFTHAYGLVKVKAVKQFETS
jgi:hypothetical protein